LTSIVYHPHKIGYRCLLPEQLRAIHLLTQNYIPIILFISKTNSNIIPLTPYFPFPILRVIKAPKKEFRMAINIKTEEHILLMEVNRPQKLNAMTQEMYHQLARAYFMLDSDPEARVGLVYAVGPHFTSGLELTDWAGTFDAGRGFPFVAENEIDPFYMMSDARCRKPIILAVQGYCYTWGFEMMLNTDIRVAATDTRFAMLEVRRGFLPGAGATLRLPKEIGWGNALRYMLTGDEMSASEAYRLGLVQLLTDPGRQFDKALELARRVASAAPLGVLNALKSCRVAALQGEEAAKAVIYQDMEEVMKSEDMKEGLLSFIERRAAVFQGK
jgi:enoyl-CoA hydratase/carnithine racemase